MKKLKRKFEKMFDGKIENIRIAPVYIHDNECGGVNELSCTITFITDVKNAGKLIEMIEPEDEMLMDKESIDNVINELAQDIVNKDLSLNEAWKRYIEIYRTAYNDGGTIINPIYLINLIRIKYRKDFYWGLYSNFFDYNIEKRNDFIFTYIKNSVSSKKVINKPINELKDNIAYLQEINAKEQNKMPEFNVSTCYIMKRLDDGHVFVTTNEQYANKIYGRGGFEMLIVNQINPEEYGY